MKNAFLSDGTKESLVASKDHAHATLSHTTHTTMMAVVVAGHVVALPCSAGYSFCKWVYSIFKKPEQKEEDSKENSNKSSPEPTNDFTM